MGDELCHQICAMLRSEAGSGASPGPPGSLAEGWHRTVSTGAHHGFLVARTAPRDAQGGSCLRISACIADSDAQRHPAADESSPHTLFTTAMDVAALRSFKEDKIGLECSDDLYAGAFARALRGGLCWERQQGKGPEEETLRLILNFSLAESGPRKQTALVLPRASPHCTVPGLFLRDILSLLTPHRPDQQQISGADEGRHGGTPEEESNAAGTAAASSEKRAKGTGADTRLQRRVHEKRSRPKNILKSQKRRPKAVVVLHAPNEGERSG